MWTDASTTALWTQILSSAGLILFAVVSAVLTFTVGMMGVGFALRKVKKYVTGRRF